MDTSLIYEKCIVYCHGIHVPDSLFLWLWIRLLTEQFIRLWLSSHVKCRNKIILFLSCQVIYIQKLAATTFLTILKNVWGISHRLSAEARPIKIYMEPQLLCPDTVDGVVNLGVYVLCTWMNFFIYDYVAKRFGPLGMCM